MICPSLLDDVFSLWASVKCVGVVHVCVRLISRHSAEGTSVAFGGLHHYLDVVGHNLLGDAPVHQDLSTSLLFDLF